MCCSNASPGRGRSRPSADAGTLNRIQQGIRAQHTTLKTVCRTKRSDGYTTSVSLELQGKPIRIASAYLAFDILDPLPGHKLQELIRDSDYLGTGLLIGCDANAHYKQSGS